jgi:hypothetical protein
MDEAAGRRWMSLREIEQRAGDVLRRRRKLHELRGRHFSLSDGKSRLSRL